MIRRGPTRGRILGDGGFPCCIDTEIKAERIKIQVDKPLFDYIIKSIVLSLRGVPTVHSYKLLINDS